MSKPSFGMTECLFFIALTFVAIFFSHKSVEATPPAEHQFVLDNGQHCKVGKDKVVMCTNRDGVFEVMPIDFAMMASK